MNRIVACAVAVAFVAGAALAQTQYRWVDDKGRVQYTDTPPPPSAKDVKKKSAAAPTAGTPVVPLALENAMKEYPVTLYSHPTCTEGCQQIRDHLNKRGVPFKESPVLTNKDLEALKALSGGNNVPVLTVGKRVETGPSAEQITSMLDAGGYPKEGILPPGKQAAPAAPKPGEMETSTPESKAAAKPAAKAAEPEAPRGPYAPGAPAPKPSAKTTTKTQ